MKVVIAASVLRRSLNRVQYALFAGAILMLGYCGFVMADTWTFQREESRELTRLLVQQVATAPDSPPIAAAVSGGRSGRVMDGLIGRIDIARLGLSVVVMEGTTAHTLRRAAGHIEGTALPGEEGNVGISGHRDTLFRPLKDIRRDDIIVVTTTAGEYRYRVVSMKIVSPEDTSVLDPGASDILTLVTCYPFYFVGPAPERFIVQAERVI